MGGMGRNSRGRMGRGGNKWEEKGRRKREGRERKGGPPVTIL